MYIEIHKFHIFLAMFIHTKKIQISNPSWLNHEVQEAMADMERLYQVHKTNPLQESQLAHTHATRRVNKVVRRAKRNKGTNVAGMAKHKPESVLRICA